VSVVDSTQRLEWEITKQEFESCEFGKKIKSPDFNIQMGSEKSKWKIHMWPKGYKEENRNEVCLGLQLKSEASYAVKYSCAFKTEDGYWPNDFVQNLYGNTGKWHTNPTTFDNQNGKKKSIGRAGKIHDLLEFGGNKVTLVATLVIYSEGRGYLKHKKIAENFVYNLRSLSRKEKYEHFSDFTIICGVKQFKCNRSVFAVMSSVFETMLMNDMFSEKHENSVSIKDSSAEIVEVMIEFISSGVIPKDIDVKAMDLIYLADKYDLKDLIQVCEESLAENISVDNAIETLIVLDRHVPKSKHRTKILAFIKVEKAKVVKVPDWKKFVVNYPDLVTDIFLA